MKEIFATFEGNKILKMSFNKQEIIDYYNTFSEYDQDKLHNRVKVNGQWILWILAEEELNAKDNRR